jgi:hypothetical protein
MSGKIMENALAKILASGSTLHVLFLSKILPTERNAAYSHFRIQVLPQFQ